MTIYVRIDYLQPNLGKDHLEVNLRSQSPVTREP